jgi:prepilin-type N-terminal cleavage/methylation domain-containing protein
MKKNNTRHPEFISGSMLKQVQHDKLKGFSLIEMLIVVGMFAVLATIASQSTLLSLRGARKSDSISDVREDLDFAMSVMDRSLKNAQSITSPCVGAVSQSITYLDEYEMAGRFACEDVNGDLILEVASGSGTPRARLTSSDIRVTSCQIICTTPAANTPAYIDISLSGTNVTGTGTELSPVTVDTRVNLRVY